MKKEDLHSLYAEFDRQAKLEAKDIAEARKYAKGILKPEVIEKQISRGQGIVLAYGMAGEVSYSLEDLRGFLGAVQNYKFRPKQGKGNVRGVPYAALIRASRPEDIQRSKSVKNATLYQRKGDIIYFQVSGIQQPHYRVQIRLEEWNYHVADTKPVLAAAQKMVRGRISFECPCGRHQYWYRYMATLGNYAIAPLERGFPKIRNRKLYGCCCKHVLKVLNELKSNRIIFLLAKQLERERNKTGFSGNPSKRILSAEDIRLAQAKRMTRDAMAALRQYENEAEKIREKQKPKPKFSKKVINAIQAALKKAEAIGKSPDTMLKGIAQMNDLKFADIKQFIKENNLWTK